MLPTSIRIPVWNGEATIGETIESVLAATEGSEVFDVEVIDDASTDGTADVVAGFGSAVRYVRHPTNIGAIANFNTCIDRADRELLHIVHADDLIDDGFYRSVAPGFDLDGVVAATGRCRIIDDHGVLRKTSRSERDGDGEWTDAAKALSVSNRIFPSLLIARRCVYDEIGRFDLALPHAADWDMWHRIAGHGSIWFVDRPLGAYRVHEGQDTTERERSGKNIIERRQAIEQLMTRVPAPDRAGLRRRALAYSALFAGRSALDALLRRDVGTTTNQIREAIRCLASIPARSAR